MKSYDNLNFNLSETAPQLQPTTQFDFAKIRDQLSRIQRPSFLKTRYQIDSYNNSLKDFYKAFDNSTEYQQAIDRGTFNESFLMPGFDDLTESYPEDRVPFLDQTTVSHKHLAPHQNFWAENGYLLVEGMIPSQVCDDYVALREKLNLGPHRFPTFTPYVEHEII